MQDRATPSLTIDVRHLQIGLHVRLDLGWMQHPFALNSFRIASEEQLATLRGLGLERVRVSHQLSDPESLRSLVDAGVLSAEDAMLPPPPAAQAEPPAVESPEVAERRRRRAALDAELACIAQAERHYAEAGRSLKRGMELAPAQPHAARELLEAQLHGLLDKLLEAPELSIRLLGEAAGDRATQHGVNVGVLALLLGQQLGLDKQQMFELGLGALLHDLGKHDLPERLRWVDPLSSVGVAAHERQYYQQHVPQGLSLGKRMGLPAAALQVLAQHHEFADGSGFPLRLAGEQIALPARIVALVNRYDRLCNPASAADAYTPHEALARLYGQCKAKFDAAVFGAFIKMMGVYPPGSLVELSDGRHGLVVTVNAARPLKPCVLVHDTRLPREDALPLELEQHPGLCIRRSVKPVQLPHAALQWLAPRPRVCYFFERARSLPLLGEAA